MGFNPLRTPIDYFTLNNLRSPGRAVVKANAPRKWQEQSGYAMAGSFLLGGGRGLAKPTAEITLATDEEWDDWDLWSTLIKRPASNQLQKAYDIWHPWLAELDIKSVVIEDVETPELSDETGLWTYKIKFIEFRKPHFALSKPDASQQKAETDPYEQRIAKLNAQYQDLANR